MSSSDSLSCLYLSLIPFFNDSPPAGSSGCPPFWGQGWSQSVASATPANCRRDLAKSQSRKDPRRREADDFRKSPRLIRQRHVSLASPAGGNMVLPGCMMKRTRQMPAAWPLGSCRTIPACGGSPATICHPNRSRQRCGRRSDGRTAQANVQARSPSPPPGCGRPTPPDTSHGVLERHCSERGWLKWALAHRVEPQLILAQRVVRPGPRGDFSDLVPLASKAAAAMPYGQLITDAGYDSEANHRFCREELGVDSLICGQEASLRHRGRHHTVPAGDGQAAGQVG